MNLTVESVGNRVRIISPTGQMILTKEEAYYLLSELGHILDKIEKHEGERAQWQNQQASLPPTQS